MYNLCDYKKKVILFEKEFERNPTFREYIHEESHIPPRARKPLILSSFNARQTG